MTTGVNVTVSGDIPQEVWHTATPKKSDRSMARNGILLRGTEQ